MGLIQSHAIATYRPVDAAMLARIYRRRGFTLEHAYLLIFGRAPRVSK
jgi:hypothetical protein